MEFEALVQSNRDHMESLGLTQLRTLEQAQAFFTAPGIAFTYVNSLCGCSQATALPALEAALESARIARMATVFAGQDMEATAKAREYWAPYPPSSPCFVITKNGSVIEMIPREEIRGHRVEDVAKVLIEALGKHI